MLPRKASFPLSIPQGFCLGRIGFLRDLRRKKPGFRAVDLGRVAGFFLRPSLIGGLRILRAVPPQCTEAVSPVEKNGNGANPFPFPVLLFFNIEKLIPNTFDSRRKNA